MFDFGGGEGAACPVRSKSPKATAAPLVRASNGVNRCGHVFHLPMLYKRLISSGDKALL